MISHSIGGVEGKLQAGQDLLGLGLLWDLSPHGACFLMAGQGALWRGQEVTLSLWPSLGVGLLTMESLVRWSDPSGRRMYVGLEFHQGVLPEGNFLDGMVVR